MSPSNADNDHALSLSSDLGIDNANRIDQVTTQKLKHQSQSPKRHSNKKSKRVKCEHHPQPYEFNSKDQSNHSYNIADYDNGSSPNQPPDLSIPTPQEGSIYPSFEALRYAIDAWALRERFLTRIYKKDSARAIYICRRASHGCEWRVRANKSGEHGSAVLVSIVQPRHTCNAENRQHDRNIISETNSKYAKRGVQFTQRWVRDALAHCGFIVSPETDPMTIVRCIEDRFGETISDKLALKAKNSFLVSRGELLPQRTAKPGRPTRAEVEERKRDMQHAMALQHDESKAGRTLPAESLQTVESVDPKIDGSDIHPYLPDNNSTTTCYTPHTNNNACQHPVELDSSSDYAIDPQLGGATTTAMPITTTILGTDRISVRYPPYYTSSDSAMATDNIATASCNSPDILPCETCNGTGLSKLYPAALHSADSGPAIDYSSPSYDINEEILLLQSQMTTLQTQIEKLKWQKQRIHDAMM